MLTVGVFKKVLSESEFQTYRGGIVLQAYLPDTTAILETLKEWAIDRFRNGGAPVRIRIVKGANRAMELVESEISGHPNPLFTDKIDTDAHFKTLILACCATDVRPAIELGIATHNIFDLTFALWIRHHHHPTAMIEMLQGMADDLIRVLIQNDVPVLVYTPIAKPSQYLHAVAYLIRRLDENTGSDHFLGVAHSVIPGDSQWRYIATLFQKSIDRMRSLDTRSRRTILEIPAPLPPHDPDFAVIPSGFVSTSDSDWTLPATVAKLRRELSHPMPLAIPPHVQSNQLQTVVQTAVMGHEQWHHHPNRSHLLMAWADQLEDHRLNLSHAMVTEVHKTATEADAEVSEAIDFIRYYLCLYQDMRRQFEHPIVGKGPALVCPPWNFPLAIPIGAIAANLIVGNSVIFKPAPEAKGIGQRLAELAWVSGIPQYALQCIAIDDADGQQLVNDPSIATVMLTGSTQTAHHFLDWRPDLNLIAETGGKNTLIVSGMCDRDLAIRDIVQSAFGFSGQKCSAVSVLILEKSLYDDPTFITHLKEAVEAIPNIHDSQLPVASLPLIRPPSPELLVALTDLDIGEEWVVLPKEIAPNHWTPGVKRGSQPGSRSTTIEFFGPVLSVIRATSMSDAIAIANQSQYGLTAGLHSLDPTDISEWVTIIRAGNLYVNRTTTGAIVGRQPFGGTKASCIGNGLKAGGPLYLTPLVRPVPFNHHPYVSHLVQWRKKMTLPQRTSRLSGQTNTYWLKHRENQYLIIDGSTPKETAVLAAQIAAQFHVPIQLVNPSPQLFSKIHDYCRTVRATKLEEIDQYITTGTYGAIRWIGPLPLNIRRTANENNVPLFAHPLGDHALWELPRWLREVSLSHTTHRFGNTTMGNAT
ncbi:aldehyde dehydrogenase family protein [bacterium]|nr:aldehyde dehydrogenase family protein [bacterium]